MPMRRATKGLETAAALLHLVRLRLRLRLRRRRRFKFRLRLRLSGASQDSQAGGGCAAGERWQLLGG